jgi:hypothetical protein
VDLVGRIKHGLGAANKTLSLQIPLIAQEFPEIASCHRGSINLELDAPLLVMAPDHRTKPIAWLPNSPQTEMFDFLRVQLEAPVDTVAVQAWLYIPHGSPHRRTPCTHEVITSHIDLAGVVQCRIRIDRPAVQIPWGAFPAVIVV